MSRIQRGSRWLPGSLLCVFVAALPGLALGAEAATPAHKYVGAKKCQSCHKKELIGDQYGEWKKGVHAKAFETLKGEKAAELAKKKGIAGPPHEAGECLKCHMTGHGLPASAFKQAPLKPADGIQCESCHGPGADYKSKKIMSDHDRAVAKGMWDPEKDEKICLECHNDESPTWDPAKGFDFEAAKEKIAHPIPKDVKGKYLEIVKQRKAGQGGSADEE
jgi:hypothetical protein